MELERLFSNGFFHNRQTKGENREKKKFMQKLMEHDSS